MKWTNPGHQLDDLGTKFLKVKKLYIYGIDGNAEKLYRFLKWLKVANEFAISFVVDVSTFNNISEHSFYGERVIPFQTELINELSGDADSSVVALLSFYQTNEIKMLEQIGVANIFFIVHSYNRRDNFIQNFLCVWLMYKHGKLLSHWTNFVTTLKCNLNCKYCLNYTGSIEAPKDVSFEDFKKHIDIVFSKFDYLFSLHFCGGEPTLVKDLPKFIRYIEKNYKDRIFDFFIITNSTIIPSNDTIEAVKAMNGSFLLDDYSINVPNVKVKEITELLTDNGIGYVVNRAVQWFDLDYGNTDNCGLSDEELESYKDNCNSFFHEFGENRIYACCYPQYAYRAGIGTPDLNEYIEIADASKMEILEFRQGYTHKGYVDFCKHCRGGGSNAKSVPAAIQIPRAKKGMYSQSTDNSIKKDTVTICVPIYNTSKYLTRCVDSLIAQTHKNLEIILVDDGSTDGSGLICDEYTKVDPRVKVVHKTNGGEASARNAGLHAANGEYIMFIDSDDEYLPNAVGLMIDAIKHDETDLVIGGYLEKSGDVERFATGHQRQYTANEIAYNFLTSQCQFGIMYITSTINAKLFKREILRSNEISFDERFVVGNDSIFMCEYLKHVRKIYNVFAPIYVYYKFDPSERIQGMRWYYPDAFFLYAYVNDKMIKLAKPDEAESNRLIKIQYKYLLSSMLRATADIEHLSNGLMPYLTAFCDEIDLLKTGAKLYLEESRISKEDEGLPFKLMSYLIVNKHYNELYEMLRVICTAKNITPYKGENVREMIKLNNKESCRADESQHSDSYSFTDDRILMEQLGELITVASENQQRSAEYASRISSLETTNSILEVRAKSFEQQTAQADIKINELGATIAENEAKINELQAAVNCFAAKSNEAEKELDKQRAVINELTAKANEAATRASALEAHIHALEPQLNTLQAIESSTCWRMTKPFRKVLDIIKK